MKQQLQLQFNIAVIAAIATFLLILLSSSQAIAQIQNKSPSPPPSAVPPQITAPQLPLPPQAQADRGKNIAILEELFNKIGPDTSQGHVAAVLKVMQTKYPDKVHCPSFVPANCYVISKAPGVPPNISPPDVR